ncbi:hypothetical protein [Actinoplanes aureus]|uniref:Uncharacterized protein n=1 Tax=Actinoplanes aureus TaxID=2792083 RepID=A0A931CCQ1_9ACTN|nr:hypothetical protein [Actinoplanes aureus]MBG0564936.1 hypothetical protein [Actinoplanes aureus]
MADARDFLLPPAEPEDSMANGFANPGEFFNYVSPSAWIADIVERISGWNPFDWASEYFTGEWGEFHKFGTTLANLADFMQEIGAGIQANFLEADRSWSGNAADSAFAYFTSLAAAVSSQQFALNEAAHGYHEAARGVWQLSKQLGNILQAMADEAILAGLTAVAGTVTMATGAGAVVGYSMAAYHAIQILKLAARASKIINTALIVILSLFGGAVALTGQGGDLSAVQLPETSFDLPRS